MPRPVELNNATITGNPLNALRLSEKATGQKHKGRCKNHLRRRPPAARTDHSKPPTRPTNTNGEFADGGGVAHGVDTRRHLRLQLLLELLLLLL